MPDYVRDFNTPYDQSRKTFNEERDTARPVFYLEKALNAKGELVDVEMVKINQPNERLGVWGGKVTDEHRRRWPNHYEAFKRNELAPVEGTPLGKWGETSANVEFVDMLRGIGIWTVEDLAGLSDAACQNFHGGPTWRKRAQEWLAKQTKTSSKDDEIAALRKMVEELSQRVSSAPQGETQPIRKKPGPKPKAQPEAA